MAVHLLLVGLLVTCPCCSTRCCPTWPPQLDQKWAGGALIAVAEVIGLPMLLTAFVAWMRQDRVDAERIDAELDAASEDVAGAKADDGLWWITQPRDRGVR